MESKERRGDEGSRGGSNWGRREQRNGGDLGCLKGGGSDKR